MLYISLYRGCHHRILVKRLSADFVSYKTTNNTHVQVQHQTAFYTQIQLKSETIQLYNVLHWRSKQVISIQLATTMMITWRKKLTFVDLVLLNTFQKRRVSSPAPVTIDSPSGDMACQHQPSLLCT